MSSGDVDRTLRTLRGLTRGARHRRRIQEELADHLQEAATAECARGLEAGAAERRAVERFGDPRVVARAFPISRWRWPAAMLALAGTGALAWAEAATHQASIRTCFGGRCPVWLPRAPQHPIHERVETVTAAAAAILAVGLAVSAVWRRHQAGRAYRRALAGDAERQPSITTALLLRDALRRPTQVAAVGLTLAVVAGAGLAMRWQTEAPPATGMSVLPLRPAVLGHHPGTLTGMRRARPVLRRILSQMPSDFVSVGVQPGKGLVIRTPSWEHTEPDTTSDPNILLDRFEVLVLERSFAGLQVQAGLHEGTFETESESGSLRVPPASPPATSNIGRRIASRLHRLGLQVKSLRITHPYGPLAIAVACTPDPKPYIERPLGPLSSRIRWGALIIEDTTGAVRFVYTTELGSRKAETWFDPGLFPAQPSPRTPIPLPAPAFRPPPRGRVTRT